MTAAGDESTWQDVKQLTELNLQFVDAFRKGSWALLRPVLSPAFRYLDAATPPRRPGAL